MEEIIRFLVGVEIGHLSGKLWVPVFDKKTAAELEKKASIKDVDVLNDAEWKKCMNKRSAIRCKNAIENVVVGTATGLAIGLVIETVIDKVADNA